MAPCGLPAKDLDLKRREGTVPLTRAHSAASWVEKTKSASYTAPLGAKCSSEAIFPQLKGQTPPFNEGTWFVISYRGEQQGERKLSLKCGQAPVPRCQCCTHCLPLLLADTELQTSSDCFHALVTLVLGSTLHGLVQGRSKAQREVLRRTNATGSVCGKDGAWHLPASWFTHLKKIIKAEFSSTALGEQVLLPSAEQGVLNPCVTPAWPGLS